MGAISAASALRARGLHLELTVSPFGTEVAMWMLAKLLALGVGLLLIAMWTSIAAYLALLLER